jgi:enamine deaminase RidA (YjgF/YER057c/UK114 family)
VKLFAAVARRVSVRLVPPEQRLAELGIALPAVPALDGPRLKRVVVHAGFAFVSGDGDESIQGYVGSDVSVDEAIRAARTTAHRHCTVLREALGSLDRVDHWVKTLVLVRSAPGFGGQPAVANGYSEAIIELWGEELGLGARSAIGVAELPGGMAVEVEAIVALA